MKSTFVAAMDNLNEHLSIVGIIILNSKVKINHFLSIINCYNNVNIIYSNH